MINQIIGWHLLNIDGVKMKKFNYLLLTLLSLTALNAQSQSLRLTGYEGVVVLTNGSRFEVSGGNYTVCKDEFDRTIDEQTAITGADVYYGLSGTQNCTPNFIYRSPTAPGASLSPAAELIPQLPIPPRCLSCLIFEYPGLIKDIFPDHSQLVESYVQTYKIDQYNQDLLNLQNQYKSNLEQFEKKMFQLEEYLAEKDK
jgi:hypothetical protein